jgi:hypothetical protein
VPDHRRQVEPLAGIVKDVRAALGTVVDHHLQPARQAEDGLLQSEVGVTAPSRFGGDVVDVEDPRNRKGDVPFLLGEGEVSLRVRHHRQLDHSALVYPHCRRP